jgi:HK97 family phage portal protein
MVRAAIAMKMDTFTEGRVVVRNAATKEEIPRHFLLRALKKPTNTKGPTDLFRRIVQDLDIFGNAFVELVRDGAGRVVEVWRMHPMSVRIQLGEPSRGEPYLVAYWINVGGGWSPIPASNVVHWAHPDPGFGQDAFSGLFGTPPLLSALRSLTFDSELADQMVGTLQNNAIPPVVLVASKENRIASDAQAEEARRMWTQRYSNSRGTAGGVAVSNYDVKLLGMNWKEMAIGDVINVPESRIAGVLRVPMLLLNRSEDPTYANREEAMVDFWSNTIRPLGRTITEGLSTVALPTDRAEVYYDTTQVDALQAAQLRRYESAAKVFAVGLVSRHEAQMLADGRVHGPDELAIPNNVTMQPTTQATTPTEESESADD